MIVTPSSTHLLDCQKSSDIQVVKRWQLMWKCCQVLPPNKINFWANLRWETLRVSSTPQVSLNNLLTDLMSICQTEFIFSHLFYLNRLVESPTGIVAKSKNRAHKNNSVFLFSVILPDYKVWSCIVKKVLNGSNYLHYLNVTTQCLPSDTFRLSQK